MVLFNVAGSTGFEPAISSVTGRRVRPLHYEPKMSWGHLCRQNAKRNCNKQSGIRISDKT